MNKPPIGVKPYWISAFDRISDLAQAIDRYSDEKNTTSIKLWAKEIISQCDLVEEMTQLDETR